MALAKKPKYTVFCPQGKSFSVTVRLKDKFLKVTQLTDCTATCQIREALPDPENLVDAVLTLTTADGDIEIDEDSGTVTVNIDAVRTAALPVASYIWELEVNFPDGHVPYFMAPSPFKVIAEANLA